MGQKDHACRRRRTSADSCERIDEENLSCLRFEDAELETMVSGISVPFTSSADIRRCKAVVQ